MHKARLPKESERRDANGDCIFKQSSRHITSKCLCQKTPRFASSECSGHSSDNSRNQANDHSMAGEADRETAQGARHDSGDEPGRSQSARSPGKLVVDQLPDSQEGQDVRGERVAKESKPSVVQ